MFKIISLIIIVFYAFPLFSQSITIVGNVVDKSDGQAISQAQISIDGLNAKAITDDNGSFSLKLIGKQKGDLIRLRIMKTGYKPLNINIVASSELSFSFKLINIKEQSNKDKKALTKIKKSDVEFDLNDLIDDLYKQDYLINVSLQQLLLHHKQKFLQKQVISIINAFQIFDSHSSNNNFSLKDEITNNFNSLLIDLSEEQSYSSEDITAFIEAFLKTNSTSESFIYIFNFIKRSKHQQAQRFIEQLVISRNPDFYKDYDIKDSALQCFFDVNNIKEDSFYIDYLDQFKDKSGMMYRPFYDVIFNLASNRKDYVLKILNSKELVNSFFKNSGFDYEGNFIEIRKEWKEYLSKFISQSDLDDTYFFSVLCPCYLGPSPQYRRQNRQLPCDSTHMKK